jgi:hypothetical protein
MESYNTSRSTVVKSIKKASSKLTISFDRWKANNEVDLTLGWGILEPTPKRGRRGDPYRELWGESILRNIPIIRQRGTY